MLVERFLKRLSQSSPAQRAEIVRVLVRVYLEVPLDAENRTAAATALVAILDDPAPRVRRAMSEGLAASADAPRPVIRALSEDLPDVAHPVLSQSPILRENELIDIVGTGCARAQQSIAGRAQVGIALSAAIVEVADADTCLILLQNPGAEITLSTLRRVVERHSGDAAVRTALLERTDLPVTVRQKLIDGLSEALGDLVSDRDWLPADRTKRMVSEAQDRAIVRLAASCSNENLTSLVKMLAAESRITPALLLRALAFGDIRFVAEAFAAMSRMPVRRVISLLDDTKGRGIRSLYRRTGLPEESLPAIWSVIEVLRVEADKGTWNQQRLMTRSMLERALAQYEKSLGGEVDEYGGLIGRLAADVARDEARCETGGYFRAA